MKGGKQVFKRGNLIKLIIMTILLLTIPSGRHGTARSAANTTSEPLSIILLIDVSGSMSRTDPQRLRETAAGIFIDMLSPEDYLGVIIFDDEVEVVIPLEQVKDYDNKRMIKEILFPKLDPRGFTDYNGAFKTVFTHLKETDIQGAQPVVIFLTDGDPNPYADSRDNAVFMARYMAELWEIIKSFNSERYPIYSIGFSYEIQPGVLEKISLETRGGYYILEKPEQLLVTFFELLGGLKNRQIIIEETLSGGREKSFPFLVDEYTRQVNLVTASQSPGIVYSLLTPDGSRADPGQVPGLFVTEDKGNALIVLHQLEDKYFGEWNLSVAGSSQVQVLGDKDIHIQVSLEEPLPFSQQPVNEPLEFRVSVSREGVFRDVPLNVEVQLSGPGIEQPVIIPLGEVSEGVFSGTFERLSRPGTYEVQVRLLQEDELLSSTSTNIYGMLIPSLTTDFHIDEDYVTGEEFIVTSSLYVRGNRLTEGKDLGIKEFKILINYDDGTSAVIPFYDSGNYEEHGDLRAADGIWSNRVALEKAGKAEAYLIAAGAYRGTEFLLEKRLGDISLFEPGKVLVSTQGSFWSVPGRTMSLPLLVKNDSVVRDTLLISVSGDVGSMDHVTINLEPGETRSLKLKMDFDSGLKAGSYQVELTFENERESSVLEPASLIVPVELLTPRDAFMHSYLGAIRNVSAAVFVFLIFLFLAVLLGLLLYKINISPLTRIKGSLHYRKSGATRDKPWQEIMFRGLRNKAVISLDPQNRKADFQIKDSEFSYDIEIRALWPGKGPRFIQGLRSLKKKYLPVKMVLRCTPPGVFEYSGNIYTEKELLHEDRFESGGLSFHYINPYAKWDADKEDGVDILGGKLYSSHENSHGV